MTSPIVNHIVSEALTTAAEYSQMAATNAKSVQDARRSNVQLGKTQLNTLTQEHHRQLVEDLNTYLRQRPNFAVSNKHFNEAIHRLEAIAKALAVQAIYEQLLLSDREKNKILDEGSKVIIKTYLHKKNNAPLKVEGDACREHERQGTDRGRVRRRRNKISRYFKKRKDIKTHLKRALTLKHNNHKRSSHLINTLHNNSNDQALRKLNLTRSQIKLHQLTTTSINKMLALQATPVRIPKAPQHIQPPAHRAPINANPNIALHQPQTTPQQPQHARKEPTAFPAQQPISNSHPQIKRETSTSSLNDNPSTNTATQPRELTAAGTTNIPPATTEENTPATTEELLPEAAAKYTGTEPTAANIEHEAKSILNDDITQPSPDANTPTDPLNDSGMNFNIDELLAAANFPKGPKTLDTDENSSVVDAASNIIENEKTISTEEPSITEDTTSNVEEEEAANTTTGCTLPPTALTYADEKISVVDNAKAETTTINSPVVSPIENITTPTENTAEDKIETDNQASIKAPYLPQNYYSASDSSDSDSSTDESDSEFDDYIPQKPNNIKAEYPSSTESESDSDIDDFSPQKNKHIKAPLPPTSIEKIDIFENPNAWQDQDSLETIATNNHTESVSTDTQQNSHAVPISDEPDEFDEFGNWLGNENVFAEFADDFLFKSGNSSPTTTTHPPITSSTSLNEVIAKRNEEFERTLRLGKALLESTEKAYKQNSQPPSNKPPQATAVPTVTLPKAASEHKDLAAEAPADSESTEHFTPSELGRPSHLLLNEVTEEDLFSEFDNISSKNDSPEETPSSTIEESLKSSNPFGLDDSSNAPYELVFDSNFVDNDTTNSPTIHTNVNHLAVDESSNEKPANINLTSSTTEQSPYTDKDITDLLEEFGLPNLSEDKFNENSTATNQAIANSDEPALINPKDMPTADLSINEIISLYGLDKVDPPNTIKEDASIDSDNDDNDEDFTQQKSVASAYLSKAVPQNAATSIPVEEVEKTTKEEELTEAYPEELNTSKTSPPNTSATKESLDEDENDGFNDDNSIKDTDSISSEDVEMTMTMTTTMMISFTATVMLTILRYSKHQ